MNILSRKELRSRGYTLIEVLVSSAILLIGVSAAASLTLTMTTQEEMNYRVSRGLNVLESYGRLYQLGLEPAEIVQIMPADPAVASVVFAQANTATLEGQIFTMTISPVEDLGAWSDGEWTAGSQATVATRSAVIRSYRPSTQ